jgi:uncharacterized protein (TIGR00106 family)
MEYRPAVISANSSSASRWYAVLAPVFDPLPMAPTPPTLVPVGLDKSEPRPAAVVPCQAMLVAFSITPLGVGEGVGEQVAEAVRVVRESGLPNRTDAMFTTVEGEWDEVMDVIRRACEAVDAPRVSLVLKADIRPGVTDALTSKVETVERHLRDG